MAQDGKGGGKADKWAARSARLSAALRENLKRRKEQARARMSDGGRGVEPDLKPTRQETANETGWDSSPAKPETGD